LAQPASPVLASSAQMMNISIAIMMSDQNG
jgi:hypothetical protein